jgi:hypothetical protein
MNAGEARARQLARRPLRFLRPRCGPWSSVLMRNQPASACPRNAQPLYFGPASLLPRASHVLNSSTRYEGGLFNVISSGVSDPVPRQAAIIESPDRGVPFSLAGLVALAQSLHRIDALSSGSSARSSRFFLVRFPATPARVFQASACSASGLLTQPGSVHS